jgi:hypothetical protein
MSMNDVERALDLKSRKHLGFLVGSAVFILTAVIFTISYDWGFVLGLVPALIVGGAFGWISYRFLWVGIAIAALFEMFSIMG